MFFGAAAPWLVALGVRARAVCGDVTGLGLLGLRGAEVASGFVVGLVVVVLGPVESSGMGQVTKKALDTAQQKFLAAHAAEIEAMAVIADIQEQRDKLDAEHDAAVAKLVDKHTARAKELDMELGLAVASARESMPAKKVAATLGVSEHRQKKLLELLDTSDTHHSTDDSSTDSATA